MSNLTMNKYFKEIAVPDKLVQFFTFLKFIQKQLKKYIFFKT